MIVHCVPTACALGGGRAGGKHKVPLVERSSATPIDDHGVYRPVSLFLDQQYARTLRSKVPIAPGEHRQDDWPKITAHLGQNIFVARRSFVITAALQEARIDHGAQATGKHIGRDVQAS